MRSCHATVFVKPGISTGGSKIARPLACVASRRGTTAIRSRERKISGNTRKLVTETVTRRSQPGRVAWHGWAGENETRLDVHHAWLIEDLAGGRVRILTQETQKGKPAAELAKTRPNPMTNGHQEWLDGLIDAARKAKNERK